MIVNPGDWGKLWELVEEDFNASSEKGVSLLFSVQEVETVCALKMLQVSQLASAAGKTLCTCL
jgi:hypothetical protein